MRFPARSLAWLPACSIFYQVKVVLFMAPTTHIDINRNTRKDILLLEVKVPNILFRNVSFRE